jgi:LysM repeat protein
VPRPRGDELKRYAAPAAFLVAVTVAVLLIHSGLQSGGKSTATVASVATTTGGRVSGPVTQSSTRTGTTSAQYYTVQSGDTLGAIAAKYGTTVEQLQGLNPNVDPAALQPGQRIRVK